MLSTGAETARRLRATTIGLYGKLGGKTSVHGRGADGRPADRHRLAMRDSDAAPTITFPF